MGEKKRRRENQERLRAGDGKTKRWKNRVWERSGKRVSREKGRKRQARKAVWPSCRELDSQAMKSYDKYTGE